MKIVLVRHGRSEANDARVCAGWHDTPLSEAGIDALKALRATETYPQTDRYYSSDLSRAVDTFRILYGSDTPLHESSTAFRELSVGDYENQTWDSMELDIFGELFGRNNPVVNGETVTQMSLRVFGKLTKILHEMHEANEESVTIVCHAGVIMMVLTFLSPLAFEKRNDIETPNGLGYILEVDFNPKDYHIALKSVEKIWKS